jgi:hypothetical protein
MQAASTAAPRVLARPGETDERLANLFNRLNATTRQVVGAWG